MKLINNKNEIYGISIICFIFLSIIFHLLIPSEFRDQRTKIDLITFLLFCILFYITISYINWKFRKFVKYKSLESFIYPILFLLLLSYISFYIFFINHILAITTISSLYLYLLIDSLINFKKFINYLKSDNQFSSYVVVLFVGFFYILVVHLFETIGDKNIEWITANRWINLPIDNEIPRRFADKMYQGHDPRNFLFGLDWSSSDRPPLLTGIILFFRPLFEFINIPSKSSAYAAGLGYQLIWIPILLNILRSIKINYFYSLIILLGFASNGFIFYNSIFVWPKLGAGALLLYAFFIYHKRGLLEFNDTIVIAILTALAWLSHSGLSLSILPIVFIVLCRPKFYQTKNILVATVVIASLCLPWLAYQKLYDPPGDRLLKWHIGGQPDAIDKNLTETIHESYSNITFEQWIENRKLNFLRLFGDRFSYLSFMNPSSSERIVNDFYFFFRSHEIIILLSCLLTIYLICRKRFTCLISEFYKGRLFLTLLFLSLTFWIFLLFMPKSTVIHQGSYLNNLILMIVLHIFLYKFSKPLLILNTIIYMFYFAITYFPEYNSNFGSINYFSLFNLISLILISILTSKKLIKRNIFLFLKKSEL